MRPQTRQGLSFWLADQKETNVRTRPDYGSPWIGVPSRLEENSNIFVKKAHNEPFSVLIMHNNKEYDYLENVVKIFIYTDIFMTEVGCYHSYFDLDARDSEEVIIVLQNGTKRVLKATRGQIDSTDPQVAQLHVSPEPAKNDVPLYKKRIVACLDVMMNLSTSRDERQRASDSLDILLPLFRSEVAPL